MDSVMKGLMEQCHPYNFWARTAPDLDLDPSIVHLYRQVSSTKVW